MAFKEKQDLDCDTTTALGGKNRQTGKPNPTKIEGYFIGSKDTVSKKSKNGIAKLHILQTAKGNVGVWGKTDLDRKMSGLTPGVMVRITQSGTVNTPNGEMYKFKVEFDEENTIEVNLPTAETASEEEAAPATDESEDFGAPPMDEALDEEEPVEEDLPPPRAVAPSRPAAAPDAARQAKVKALLAGKRG